MTAFSRCKVWHFYCSSISFHIEVHGSKEKQQKAKKLMNASHDGFAAKRHSFR